MAQMIRTLVFSPAKNEKPICKAPWKTVCKCTEGKSCFLHTCPNFSQYCSFAGRFREASWRRCHSSSGFSLSQFVLFLHVIPERLMMIRSDLCVEHRLMSDSLCKQKSHWIITINGKINVCKCKLIFPTDTQQQKVEITDLKPLFSWWKD